MSNPHFQNSMNRIPAMGISGQKVPTNPVVYFCKPLKTSHAITSGVFVWADGDEVSSSGTGQPLGLAMALDPYFNTDILSGADNKIPENEYVSVCIKGDFFVTTSTACSAGDKVFANLSDGTVKTDEADSTVENAIETSFTVVTGGEADDVIVISNWI